MRGIIIRTGGRGYPLLMLFLGLCCLVPEAEAQVVITGKITDGKNGYSLYPATILNQHSGAVVSSDSSGFYRIKARAGDTLRFSYLGYRPAVYKVPEGLDRIIYDAELSPGMKRLTEVEVQALSPYARDSLDRITTFGEYLSKPTIPPVQVMMHNPGDLAGIGFTFHPFSYFSKAEKRKRRFRKMYAEFERKDFVESRYTPRLVTRLTGLKGDSLRMFLLRFEPSYDFTREATDLEFWSWIKIRYDFWTAATGKEMRRRAP